MRILLAFFFHHLYHSFAWAYDLIAWAVSLGQWNAWVLSALPFVPNGRILEIGFGTGHLLAAMDRSGVPVVGLDESWSMNRMVSRKYPGLKTVRAAAQSAPFSAGSFAGIVATFPAPYIFHGDTASEFYRLLSPGGTLVVLLAAHPNGKSIGDRFVQGLFHLTGQGGPQRTDFARLFSAYNENGFQTRVEWQQSPHADLLFLKANKPANESKRIARFS